VVKRESVHSNTLGCTPVQACYTDSENKQQTYAITIHNTRVTLSKQQWKSTS